MADPNRKTWTPDEIAAVKRMLDSGDHTFKSMTQFLPGRSRNAIVGLAHRMGWGATRTLAKPLALPLAGARKGTLREPSAPRPLPPMPILPVLRPEPPPAPPVAGGVLLDDLKSTHCRWPSGNEPPYVFCGATPKGLSPYCAHHHGMAYTKHKAFKNERTHVPAKKSGIALRYSYGIGT